MGLFQNTMASPLALFYWNFFCQEMKWNIKKLKMKWLWRFLMAIKRGGKSPNYFIFGSIVFTKNIERWFFFYITYMIHSHIWWNPFNNDFFNYIFLWMIAQIKIPRKNIVFHNGMNPILGRRNHTPFIECSPYKI